jgi:ribosomal protein L7/L12
MFFGYTFVKKSDLPFYEEVHRLIEKHPEYLEGIKQGTVHIRFGANQSPFPKREKKKSVVPEWWDEFLVLARSPEPGAFINAIKLYRAHTGASLRDSKDLADKVRSGEI